MSYTDFLLQIGVAIILSGLIGFERQWRRRSIGLRTTVLVCIGSFLFVSCSLLVETATFDLRMAAQVVSGMGFLGAGVILKDGANIRGLNTAATLWSTAAIGVLCSLNLLIEAATGTALILMSNIVLRQITKQIVARSTQYKKAKYKLKLVVLKEKELGLRTLLLQSLSDQNMSLDKLDATAIEDGKKIELEVELIADRTGHESIENLVGRFSIEPGVTYVGYTVIKDDDYDYEDVAN